MAMNIQQYEWTVRVANITTKRNDPSEDEQTGFPNIAISVQTEITMNDYIDENKRAAY